MESPDDRPPNAINSSHAPPAKELANLFDELSESPESTRPLRANAELRGSRVGVSFLHQTDSGRSDNPPPRSFSGLFGNDRAPLDPSWTEIGHTVSTQYSRRCP